MQRRTIKRVDRFIIKPIAKEAIHGSWQIRLHDQIERVHSTAELQTRADYRVIEHML